VSAAMTRYFFHIKYKGKLIRDEEGMDLQDLHAVRDCGILGSFAPISGLHYR
jgi:hypothetical protein